MIAAFVPPGLTVVAPDPKDWTEFEAGMVIASGNRRFRLERFREGTR